MTTWTEARIAEVTRLWNEGLTTAEIGRAVGVSKNAVVGKAHRLGLPPRPSPIRNGSAVRAPSATARRRVRPVAKVEKAEPTNVVKLVVGKAPCRWPIGHPDEPDFHFCGERALVGKPYCKTHYDLAYIRVRPRSDAAA